MRKELGELRDTYRQVGGRRFWAIVIPLLVWALAGVWLDGAVTWPTQCDVSGAGDLGYVQKLGCSARLLSGGRTTKETAATLFLSPKTVEYHLRHVYQKLGINSRGDLAAALAADPEVGAG